MGKFKTIAFALLAASILLSILIYPSLPDRFATHWGASGKADGFSGKTSGAFLTPVLSAVIFALFQILPRMDPHRKNYDKFRSEYEFFQAAFCAFFLGLNATVLLSAIGVPVSVPSTVVFMTGLLFVSIGLILPKLRKNYFIGIRTPWTLASETVWKKTHSLGGKVFLLLGVFSIVSSLVYLNFLLFMSAIILSTGGIVIYSYSAYKETEK